MLTTRRQTMPDILCAQTALSRPLLTCKHLRAKRTALHESGHAGFDYFVSGFVRGDLSLQAEDEGLYDDDEWNYWYDDHRIREHRQLAWDEAAVCIAGAVAELWAWHPDELTRLFHDELTEWCGAHSDLRRVRDALQVARVSHVQLQVQVLSVIRNPRMWTALEEIADLLENSWYVSMQQAAEILHRRRAPTRMDIGNPWTVGNVVYATANEHDARVEGWAATAGIKVAYVL